MNFAQAALAKINITYGQGFVHQQYFRIDVDGDCEGQPDHHAAGISLDRLVHEIADLGELGDIGELAVHLFGGKPKNSRVQIHIIAARKLRIETGAELQQRRDPAIHIHRAGGWLQNTRADLQERALAAAIFADDAKGFAADDFEADVAQRPVILMKLAAVKGGKFLQTVARRVIDGITLRYTRKFDGESGHYLRL